MCQWGTCTPLVPLSQTRQGFLVHTRIACKQYCVHQLLLHEFQTGMQITTADLAYVVPYKPLTEDRLQTKQPQ